MIVRLSQLVLAASAVAAVVLAGCGGGVRSVPATAPVTAVAPPFGGNSNAPVQVQFTIAIPTRAPGSVGRHLQYVSGATQSAVVTATQALNPPDTGTINCVAGTCSGTIAIHPGMNTIVVGLYDQTGGAGSLLSRGSVTQMIARGGANAVQITFNPVVDSFAVYLPFFGGFAQFIVGTPVTNAALHYFALDADGYSIAAPGAYIDVNGNPITLTVTAVDHGGAVSTLSGGTITDTTATPTLSYNGGSAGYIELKVSSSAPVPHGAGGISIPIINGGNLKVTALPFWPQSIFAGSDGSLYAYGNGVQPLFSATMSHDVARITGGVVTDRTMTGNVIAGTNGPDGNPWFVDDVGNAAKMSSGVLTQYAAGGNLNTAITSGPGGLWFTSNFPTIGLITTAGAYTGMAAPGGVGPIVTGPDGNLWYVAGANIVRFKPPSTVSSFHMPSNHASTLLVSGNYLWYTSIFTHAIGRVAMDGTITEFTLAPNASNPYSLVAGPDGNVWFPLIAFGVGQFTHGMITPAGQLTFYHSPFLFTPTALTAGADGNLWFGDVCLSEIGAINPANGQVIKAFGLPAPTINSEYSPSVLRYSDGNVYFPTPGGLGQITP